MLRQRFVTAVIALVALLLVLFVAPAGIALAVIALLVLAGGWEWSAFLARPTAMRRGLFVAVLAALLSAGWWFATDLLEPVLWVSLAAWLLAFCWTFFFPTPVPATVRWLAGFAVLLPLFMALRALYTLSPALLLFALLVVWVADSGAYFAGRRFGRVKLAPKISPGKTWEGVIGGLVAVIALCVAATAWLDVSAVAFIPFCLAVAGLSIVGDLTVSMFKRTAGVKDSGTLFPGHGGVLDRVDSVAAAAPLFVLGVMWLGIPA